MKHSRSDSGVSFDSLTELMIITYKELVIIFYTKYTLSNRRAIQSKNNPNYLISNSHTTSQTSDSNVIINILAGISTGAA
jgi:hypothetical protein